MRHAVLVLLVFAVAGAGGPELRADWPQFRGPRSNSVASSELDWPAGEVPVAWTAPLPGRGPSSPIVVGQKVFVTASSGVQQDRLHVLAFDAIRGKPLWERQFWATGRCLSHPSSANAAPTPASDGQRLFAFYSSNDLVCLDLDGNLLWYRGLAHDFPRVGNDAGMSSSPLVLGDSLSAIVEVTLDRQGAEHLDAFESRAVADAAVQQCYRVSPGPDFVLVVFAPSMDAYHMLVRQLLEGPPSARNVKTYFSQHRAKFDPRVPVS